MAPGPVPVPAPGLLAGAPIPSPGLEAEPLVDAVVDGLRERGVEVATGVFGAKMRVELVDDGPFTVLVEAWACAGGHGRSSAAV